MSLVYSATVLFNARCASQFQASSPRSVKNSTGVLSEICIAPDSNGSSCRGRCTYTSTNTHRSITFGPGSDTWVVPCDGYYTLALAGSGGGGGGAGSGLGPFTPGGGGGGEGGYCINTVILYAGEFVFYTVGAKVPGTIRGYSGAAPDGNQTTVTFSGLPFTLNASGGGGGLSADDGGAGGSGGGASGGTTNITGRSGAARSGVNGGAGGGAGGSADIVDDGVGNNATGTAGGGSGGHKGDPGGQSGDGFLTITYDCGVWNLTENCSAGCGCPPVDADFYNEHGYPTSSGLTITDIFCS